jgi:adenylyltransferase/sulfurtransferase
LIDYEAFCAGGSIDGADQSHGVNEAGEITPTDLASALNRGDSVVVVDVREPLEWRIARIPTARLIPLAALMAAPPDLDRNADIVVYCHHGTRSAAAAHALVAAGFTRVRNLAGGIDRWSREVDPGVRRY